VGVHEARVPPPSGFPHTMLSVKRVKDNMQLGFIGKLFTNCEIKTSVQTKYLRFKVMCDINYLCDISYVQLRKALARFRCDNMQLEIVLSAWKGVPYVERLCRGCNLGKVEDEEHLLLACPNIFIRPYPSPTRALLLSSCKLQTRFAMAKFVACYQYQRTICPL
jgi:hypothetical protein